MWPLLLRALLVLVFALILFALVGPLFIDPNPAPEHSPVHVEPSAATFGFITIPVSGTPGLRVHYRDSTDPQRDDLNPLGHRNFLLLHGFTFNLSTWDPMFVFFAKEGRTVAYDQLPYGLSEKPLPAGLKDANPYAKASAIEQLLALMDALEMPQAILVGNSAGGTLALDVARRAPERVSGLILISPWVYANRPTFPAWLVNSPQMKRISLLLGRYLGKNMPLLDLAYANPERISDERRELAADHSWTPGWDLAWGALMNRSLIDAVTVSESLADITQPTLIIAGAEDQIVKMADSARAANTMPNAEFAVLPECGHVPHEECPDLVRAIIADWLRRL
ncbi:alpha/beta fold hydrolase [Thiorhodovibrio frisius]|uniref:Putative hydrolase or acyltransferase of alpha/beta superfamily n=1 Tax=Thiorhodovibrio frisius TaxID=631362 RepID=H8Z0T7_9GAMM|nr:alpha/beta hydrolase [Thiorhodovibrio frisius]EIC21319.1 putative hydrolase or acyltransferase of alpha/beta superfamily [Thiorhodovibrio frisius]WPL23902.1 2-hydroxymuconate semialdehyde hydrolase [Thiorhodovibrio frisius]